MRMGLIAALLVFLAACDRAPVTIEFTGETMGTTYRIVAIDKARDLDQDALLGAIETTLADVNSIMSNWDPNSEVSRFNAWTSLEPFQITEEFALVMEAANAVHAESDGRFDVTLGPLIELWGFGSGPPDQVEIPSDEDIEATLATIGQDRVVEFQKNPNALSKALPGTQIYLAAIAKGHGVDRLAETIRRFGVDNFLVEIGGDLFASGLNANGERWRIGIERPDAGSRTVEQVAEVSDLGMATSGDYRNYFEKDGRRYSHIIDAVTGRPITHETASVTVLANSAMEADAWATALLALGSEAGAKIAEENGLAAMFIDRDRASGSSEFAIIETPRFTERQRSQ
ncbi:MAG: FAD:protein FMN transferase [Pseudomonadota bacterium]